MIKNHVNGNSGTSGSHAYYSTGMWTILVAMLLLFFGMFIVLFTCFSSRKAKKVQHSSYKGTNDTYGNDGMMYNEPQAGDMGHARVPRRKRFGIF